MPALTRRRSTDAPHVYYDDVLAVRSRSAAATRMTKTVGTALRFLSGLTPRRTSGRNRRQLSTKPAPISKPRGRLFWRSEPRLTFGRGVASKIGPLENMRCGKPTKNYHRRNQAR